MKEGKRRYAPSATLGSSGELKGIREAEERKQRILAKQRMDTGFLKGNKFGELQSQGCKKLRIFKMTPNTKS